MDAACGRVKKVYPLVTKKRLRQDILRMMNVFKQVAYGEPVDETVGYLNMGQGEPTMREDLIELIEHAKLFITRLNTNGIKLTEEYCEALKKASPDSAQIMFYSWNEEIHNKLVGAPRYRETVEGIENALKAGINLNINTPLCTLNKDYVKTLQFLHEKGVTYVTCSGLITTGNAALEASGFQIRGASYLGEVRYPQQALRFHEGTHGYGKKDQVLFRWREVLQPAAVVRTVPAPALVRVPAREAAGPDVLPRISITRT